MAEEKFEYKVIEVKRVAKVTEGGKRIKARAVVVVGNLNGKVGVGIAKGLDIADAVMKARKQAEKNAIEVPIIDGTLPYEVRHKEKSTEVLLKPAKKGRGLIAGGSVRTVLSLAGYTDAVGKILGVTKNPLINTLATIKALEKFKNYQNKLKLKETLKTLIKKKKNGPDTSVSNEA